MPEFQLNTPPSAADINRAVRLGYSKSHKPHPYHDLSEFAQGYVEAMFFTNGDTGDSRENLLNDWGVSRLTHASVAKIAADCAAFEAANAEHLSAAKALEAGGPGLEYARADLTDQRLGGLFWFARQGHGVSFQDDSADSPIMDALQDAARDFGESYVEAWRGWIHVRGS